MTPAPVEDIAALVADSEACIAMADEIAKRGDDVLPGQDADDADADMSVLTTPLGELALDATLSAVNSAAMMRRLATALSQADGRNPKGNKMTDALPAQPVPGVQPELGPDLPTPLNDPERPDMALLERVKACLPIDPAEDNGFDKDVRALVMWAGLNISGKQLP